jgi:hypothetical protein
MKLAGNGQGCGREIRGGGKLIGVRAKTGSCMEVKDAEASD